MPTDKEIIAFKIGARARKFLGEGCTIEGYEVLIGGIAEAKAMGDSELQKLLERELEKYDERVAAADANGD